MTCHWCLRQKGKFSTRLDQTRPGVGGARQVSAFTRSEKQRVRCRLFVRVSRTYVCMGSGNCFFFLALLFSGFSALPSCRFFVCIFLVFSIAYPLFSYIVWFSAYIPAGMNACTWLLSFFRFLAFTLRLFVCGIVCVYYTNYV